MKILLVFVILAIMCVGCIIVIISSSLIFWASGGVGSVTETVGSVVETTEYEACVATSPLAGIGRMGAECGADPNGPMLPNGQECDQNSQCASGNCVGGGALGFGLLSSDECGPAGESGWIR